MFSSTDEFIQVYPLDYGQTDRQRDRQADGQRERQTDIQTER